MVATRHLFNTVHACFGWFCAKERIMAAGYPNFSPLCQGVFALRRVCLGRSSYSNLWQWLSLCPPNESGPGVSQPILMVFQVFGAVLNAQRASYPGCQRTQRPKQRWYRHLWYIFRLFMLSSVPTIKMGRATSSVWFCLWLLQPITAIAMPTKWVKA